MSLASKLLLNASNAKQLVEGQHVFVRVDFNVPLDANGSITSDLRLQAALPTIHLLVKSGASRIILASHLGRPDGRPNDSMSLKPVASYLEKALSRKVHFANDCIGEEVEKLVANAEKGAVILLENLRFHVEEEGKGKDESGKQIKASKEEIDLFRSKLCKLCDVYVNDAFGTAHRAHSSIVGFEKMKVRAAGLLMAKEISNFSNVLETPKKPVLTIMGGAKVVDKIQLISNLLDKTDVMIICGGMAFTFLKVMQGMSIGKSLFDQSSVDKIPKIVEKAKKNGVELVFPVDFIVAPAFDSSETAYTDGNIDDGMMGLDIGEKTRNLFAKKVGEASTILWNGPPGVFEKVQFEKGSIALLEAVCKSKAVKIAGGGDTTSLVLKHHKETEFDLVSTGGGASLELMEGKNLPGIASLSSH